MVLNNFYFSVPLLLLLAFSKELFFLNEELVLFFSFVILFFVVVELTGRFAFVYFDEGISSIHVRFAKLLDQKYVNLNDLMSFRLAQLELFPLLKQVFLLVRVSLPDLSKVSFTLISIFYSKLFRFFMISQRHFGNHYLKVFLALFKTLSTLKNLKLKTSKEKEKLSFGKRVKKFVANIYGILGQKFMRLKPLKVGSLAAFPLRQGSKRSFFLPLKTRIRLFSKVKFTKWGIAEVLRKEKEQLKEGKKSPVRKNEIGEKKGTKQKFEDIKTKTKPVVKK